MQEIWDFLTKNKDAIAGIVAILGIVGSILGLLWGGWKLLIERWWKQHLRVDVKVFEVIAEPAVLLSKLYATENDDSPLADHNIKYYPRDPNRDLQTELKATLNRSRYLLITAPTGFGKTREAGVLAQSMLLEGWRVLLITKTGWLDIPKTFPAELVNNRSRILIFLDDLNGLFSTGERTQSPRAEKIPMLSEASYHARLLQVLDMFEGMCTENEIRVIATARSEVDQWKVLNYDEQDKLWKRFTRFELPEPINDTIVKLLDDSTKQANLKANPEEFEAIARRSDGTYRNILLNLRRWKAQNKEVNKDDFTETLDGSWKEVYEHAINEHPTVRYVYDAIDILRQTNLELYEPVVRAVAGSIAMKNGLTLLKIYSTMNYLIQYKKIIRKDGFELFPSDGQIEAKGYKSDFLLNIQHIYHALNTNIVICSILNSTTGLFYLLSATKFLNALEENNYFKEAGNLRNNCKNLVKKLIKNKLLNSYPEHSAGLFFNLAAYEEAGTMFLKSIELNPDNSYNFLGLSVCLLLQERYGEMEPVLRKAVELDPSNTLLYYFLGIALRRTGKYEEAEAVYRKTIENNPLDADNYHHLATFIRVTFPDRLNETLPLYAKIIEIDPKDHKAYLLLASTNKRLGHSNSDQFIEKVRQLIPHNDWYKLARLESVCDNFDLAFEYLEKALRLERLDSKQTWENPDLQWIRNDPRFTLLVGPKPE